MPDLKVPVGSDDHIAGEASAAVTLVEYGDYECPDCGVAYPIVKQLQKQFGSKLRFVFRNFPLPQHEFAEDAAETAEFAASKGRFWQMHDALFEHQEEFSEILFGELAEACGLSADALNQAVEDAAGVDKIEDDVNSGEQSGVHGTPTFFLNGERHEGRYDLATLQKAVEAAVEKAHDK